MKLLNMLSNESTDYPFWLLWLLVAGLKTWSCSGFKSALVLYWNRKAWNDKQYSGSWNFVINPNYKGESK